MNTNYETAVWVMLGLLTLCLVIGAVYLVLSIRLYNWLCRRHETQVRTIAVEGGDQEAQAIPVRVLGNGNRSSEKPFAGGSSNDGERVADEAIGDPTASNSPKKENLRLFYPHAQAENEVHDLDSKTYRLTQSNEMDAALVAAHEALAVGARKLGRDHWLIGRLLNRLACIELWQNENYKALSHLETAAAVVSEWPGKCDEDTESIKRNLEYCHSRLGF